MRRFWVVGICGAVTGLAAAGMAQADDAWSLSAGARVRLTAPSVSGKRLTGTVLGIDDATLTLRRGPRGETMQVPRAAITTLEVSRGGRRGKGALIGAAAGLASGVALGLGTGHHCTGSDWELLYVVLTVGVDCRGGSRAAVLSALTVPSGALVGFLLAPGEKWEMASTDRLRIGVAPTRGGGVRAAVSLRF
jgi:hypothetical protein